MAKIFDQSPYKISVEYYPWKRALHQVEIKQANISGALPNNGQYLFADVPILTQPISILTDSKHLNLSLDKIKTLVGVWPEMYSEQLIQSQISPYINGVTAQNRHDALKLLQNKKVDYYLDIENMLEEQLATLPKEEKSHYRTQELTILNLYLIFSNDKKGTELKNYYESTTKRLLSKGELQPIYNKYHLSININEKNPH